jgi:hypothetical protein
LETEKSSNLRNDDWKTRGSARKREREQLYLHCQEEASGYGDEISIQPFPD